MRIMGVQDANGKKVLLIPVDYLTWNDKVAGAIGDLDKAADDNKNEIWLLGSASELAQAKLKERGWEIKTNVADKIGINEIGLLKNK